MYALAEDPLTSAHNMLCSGKAAAVVETAFTLTAVPITTSAVVVICSGVAANSAVVATSAVDFLAVAVVAAQLRLS